MNLFAGVDGGGTRTRAVIVDERGREIARGEAPGAVATAYNPEPAADAVSRAIGDAMEAVALDLLTRDAPIDGLSLPLAGLWAGLAGAGSSDASRAVAEALSGRGLATRLTVGTDVRAAFEDAFPEGDGVLLIAGTGSIAWGVMPDGDPVRIGGWGQQLGDEGSGYWLGLRALQRVMTEHDGREEPSGLPGPLLRACGLDDADDMVGWIVSAAKSDVAALAPVVVSTADTGDPVATEIVEAGVAGLVDLVRGVVNRTGRGGAPVVLWGGLIAGEGPLRGRVEAALDTAGYRVVDRDVDPPMGAARLALGL